MTRLLLVVNPIATGVNPSVESAVARVLGAAGAVELVRTERSQHAVELADRAEADGFTAVAVLGGDGTANEVLNGLRGRLPFAALPGGGTSVLPRAVGLSRDPIAAAEQIADALRAGREHTLPCGSMDGRLFAFNAGVGLDADVVRRVDTRGRESGRRPRDATFGWELARLIARGAYVRPLMTVRAQGLEHRSAFVVAANLNPWSYAGRLPLKLAPKASAERGLDLVAPRALRRRDVPAFARFAFLTGGHALPSERRIAYLHDVAEAIVECDRPLPAQLDGEDIGDVRSVRFGIVPAGLRLIA